MTESTQLNRNDTPVERSLIKTIRVSTEVYDALKRRKRVTQPGTFETFDEVLERVLTALEEDT